ncbi:hypothetical protein [Mucilaginibacter flavus]|uniref:hypothetical protein n=1 Tax=Mucilaginibacter flavus TaxID=931504 RepID=UPI0025B3564B|nr:hypothetical protein [Mucilaginibacter flavus]MDN3580544.1 hypothetical protein [Mucilaginibacter flavus]
MRQVVNNRYFTINRFLSSAENEVFLGNQADELVLRLPETFGGNYYCCVFHDSLTGKKQRIISFSSDEEAERLSILFWEGSDRIALATGELLYLIALQSGTVVGFHETMTGISGLCITSKNNLLVLEDWRFRIIDAAGKLLSNVNFESPEDFDSKARHLI